MITTGLLASVGGLTKHTFSSAVITRTARQDASGNPSCALAGQALWRLQLDGTRVVGRERLKMAVNSELLSLTKSAQGYQVIVRDAFTGALTVHEGGLIVRGTNTASSIQINGSQTNLLGAQLPPGAAPEAARTAMLTAIESFTAEPVTEAELERAFAARIDPYRVADALFRGVVRAESERDVAVEFAD